MTQTVTTLRTAAPQQPKTLQINIRSVYGKAAAYPVCDAAHAFADIAGSKTLTLTTLRAAQRLGYCIFNTYMGSVVGSIDCSQLRDLEQAI